MALYTKGENSKTIRIYFVQDGASCTKEMKNAFSVCQEAKFHPKIISEDSVKEINDLESNAVYVFENFSGEVFEYLSDKNCLVVGPPCITSCVTERIPIPNNGSPVYNISLRGVVITTTKLRSQDREEIKKLSGFMGAVHSDDLTLAVTHLIAENITSVLTGKCGKAVENNIPIIWPKWIRTSWELTQTGNKAPDPLNFRLPPFQGMHISCSNLSMSVKNKLQQQIESNGGIYLRTLELKKTVVLVIGDAEGKKWQFAQQWAIPCVCPSWVRESVEKGFLAPCKDHLVLPRPKCSTPTHSTDNDSFMSSNISVVPFTSSERSNVDESNLSFASDISARSTRIETRAKDTPPGNEYKKLLEDISVSEVRNAGLFLDGCKIFLSGFTPLEIEKLKKVINAGGATLFPSISDCLSHIIVGEFSVSDAKELTFLNPRPNVVKLEWLLQCIKEKSTVIVDPYLCLQATSAPPASPLSHKGLKLLKSQNGLDPESTPPASANESRAQVSRKLFVKASVAKPSPGITSESVDISALEKHALEEMNKQKEEQMKKDREMEEMKKAAEEAERLKEIRKEKELDKRHSSEHSEGTMEGDEVTANFFFQGLLFQILIFADIEKIQESIELAGGKLFTQPSHITPDYAVVPVEGSDIKTSAKNIVSLIFVEDCYDQSCLITDLEYYHRPLPGLLDAGRKLKGTVFALSGFGRCERRFLDYVISILGAVVQDMFSRSEYPEKGVKRSTHLLCKEMSGKKYEAALKWGIPVVTSSWLLDLIESSKRVSRPSSEILSQSVEGSRNREEMDVECSRIVTQPMETEDPPPPRTSLKRLSAPDSPINEPETVTGKVPHEPPPTPETIKRWKSNQFGASPGEPTKHRHGSPPTDVLKKQLWTKYGGVQFDGIEPETGKLLHDGPYGEWAQDSLSRENSFAEPPDLAAPDRPSSGEATPTRKKWKNFVSNFSENFEESPKEPMKQKRPSTPLEVIKKQLWVKYGGVNFDGIEPETGKLLSEGPYREWARNSKSRENSFAEPEGNNLERTGEESSEEVSSSLGSTLSATRRPSLLRPNNQEFVRSMNSAKNLEDSPSVRQRLSIREDISKDDRTEQAGEISHYEGNRPAIIEFNPALSSTVREGSAFKGSWESTKLASDSPQNGNETPKENVPANYSHSDLSIVPKVNEGPLHTTSVGRTKVFLLSGLPAVAKQKYEGIIRQLGAGVTQSNTYDPSTTHIIIEKPIRSEKLLCCIASGKWVLHLSYLDYCYESREYLPEEEFEWGNPASSSRLPKVQVGSTEAGLANAAYKWRLRKKDMGSAAPFREMRVVLCTAENKEPQFKRLLQAGGATILPKSDILKANYIIWEHERVEMGVPLYELASRKVHVVPPVYLGEYLVKAPPPSEYYPQPYLKVVKEKKSFRK